MAIIGVGIDLVSVPRLRAAMERHPVGFFRHIFTDGERTFCDRLPDRFVSYAGRFAAKEAFAKALGTGLRGAIGWQEIEVVDNERSRPSIRATGRAAAILGNRRVHLSITHLAEYAAAVVVIEG
ncbi:MAG: holo-ACP synthase [candidate division WOR-3 bacterium]